MDNIKIRNWDRWQTYRKDRGQPPWIKVHRCVMRNVDWVSLTDAERGQLVAIWLLAADQGGVIPASPALIQKLCFMTDPPDLKKFNELGFLDGGCHFDANMTPERRQHDQPKAEAEADKKRVDTPPIPPLKSKKRKTPIPDECTLTETQRNHAIEKNIDPEKVDELFQAFIDHHKAHGNMMLDWDRAWNTFVRNAPQFSPWAIKPEVSKYGF